MGRSFFKKNKKTLIYLFTNATECDIIYNGGVGGYKKNKKLFICNLINFVWAPESRLN